jgi:hypothetical protein
VTFGAHPFLFIARGAAKGLFLTFLSLPSLAQEAPITRVFTRGTGASYRVSLVVRSRLDGQRTEKIGDVTYAVPLTRSAECRISWRTTQRILEIAADGSARLEESLTGFEISSANPPSVAGASPDLDKESAELSIALRETLASWGIARTLGYRQGPGGQLLELRADGGPVLAEPGSPLLTSWLVRALRPAAVLPARPLRIGDRWQEPRSTSIKNWKETSAMESGEWLEAPLNPGVAARLHLVQQIWGQTPAPGGEGALEIRFHAESLSTVSLQDGSVLRATRSASQELVRVLGPVAGLPEPPRFRATLSVQVEIEGCDDASCSSTGSPSGSPGDSSEGPSSRGARP